MPSTSKFSEDMKESYLRMKDWRNVNNIVELVEKIECLQLYPLNNKEEDEFDGSSGAILRCGTCFFLYKDKALRLTPARAAKKLSRDCTSICTGRYLDQERMEELLNGRGAHWRKLKSSVIQHMLCACDGQTHFKALTALNEENNVKKANYKAAETLIKSALVSIKSKSAAVHYEEQVAFAYTLGAQVGQSGHSRKLVPDLVRCLIEVINQRAKEELPRCLPNTDLPPHYYMALDKATVSKRTNQAVIICPTFGGNKVPIIVGAPEVYKHCDDGDVKGGKAEDSAKQALELIETKFGNTVMDYMVGKELLIFCSSWEHINKLSIYHVFLFHV